MFDILVLFTWLFINHPVVQKHEAPVNIIEATEQQWFSGAPGGRTGTNYTIKVYLTTNEKIEFKNIWIGDNNVPFEVEYFTLKPPAKTKAGDSLLLVYNHINNNEADRSSAKRCPIQYDGTGLIEYIEASRARYLVIKNFVMKPKLMGQ